MTSFLGVRGRLAVGAGAGVCVAAALLAVVERDWTLATTLLLLAALWTMVASIWGVTLTMHRQVQGLDQKLGQMRRRLPARGEGRSPDLRRLRATLDKLAEDVERLSVQVGPREADGFGSRSLERRYADVLTQPASVPQSDLSAYLELLAKEATTRRADLAVIQDLLVEIRRLRDGEEQAAHQLS